MPVNKTLDRMKQLCEVVLYHYEDTSIKIEMTACLSEEGLTVDGYDIGPKVLRLLGDSDYEYILKINSAELSKLYDKLNIENGLKTELMQELKTKFGHNHGFTTFVDFLQINGIDFESSTWI